MNITIYQNAGGRAAEYWDTLNDTRLKYLAGDLHQYAISNDEIQEAVDRAVKVCKATGIPIRENFKPVFVCRNHEIEQDWRLSPLGRKLVMLNANPANPYVARLQMELVNI